MASSNLPQNSITPQQITTLQRLKAVFTGKNPPALQAALDEFDAHIAAQRAELEANFLAMGAFWQMVDEVEDAR